MKINVNDDVRVRPTERGVQMYAAYRRGLGLPEEICRPRLDAGGWLKIQLWELMRIYGSEMNTGVKPPFDTEIEIDR